jgi:hypothetical protein
MRKSSLAFFLLLLAGSPANGLAQSHSASAQAAQHSTPPATVKTPEQTPPHITAALADFDAYVQRIMSKETQCH